MNAIIVFSVYAIAFLIAAVLLYLYHTAWYWHVLAVAAALAIGLTPPPEGFQPPDLVVGFVFFLLFVWGAGELLVHPFHRHRPHHVGP